MLLGFLALDSSLKITSFTIVARLSLCALSSSLENRHLLVLVNAHNYKLEVKQRETRQT